MWKGLEKHDMPMIAQKFILQLLNKFLFCAMCIVKIRIQ